jgi:hypothetical protein
MLSEYFSHPLMWSATVKPINNIVRILDKIERKTELSPLITGPGGHYGHGV